MNKIIRLIIPPGVIILLFIISFSGFQVTSALGEAINTGIRDDTELAGPPWYDPAWHYRLPVVITNTGDDLPYYQVLVKLDSGFNFNRAKADGSDIRFAYTDGTTELKFWIESWEKDNELAYLWVRIPNLSDGNSTIYIYYGNPDANSGSDGNATFDSFEDAWGDFSGEGYATGEETAMVNPDESTNSPFTWIPISGEPSASGGILTLMDGDGIKSSATYQYNAMGMRANFKSGNGNKWGGFINGAGGPQTKIGDLLSDPDDLYLIDFVTNPDNVLLPRVAGGDWHDDFHIYEVRWKAGESSGDVDHGMSSATSSQPAQVPNVSLPVTLYSYSGSNADLLVDWVYVRQYRDPEPTFSVGSEQGLVALSINGVDFPDPVGRGELLTYELTINNTSDIDAPGVVVTDTLPGSVLFESANPSQGFCGGGIIIMCNLATINANSTASITIVVSPTIDGEITNLAAVGSPSYELNWYDNSHEQVTLVDWTPPVVNWEEPVANGGTFLVFGGRVNLVASASDNDKVAWVEFKYWDHNTNHWIIIGSDDSYPYQVQFDSSVLEINQPYQTFVYGEDQSGNQSDPYNPLQRIFLERKLPVYLPLLRR